MEQNISSILNESLNELGLQFKIIESELDLNVSFGCLVNAQGDILSYGSANGNYHSLKVISECIEHYLFRLLSVTTEVSIKNISNQESFSREKIIRNLDQNVTIQTLPFHSLLGSAEPIYIPAAWCIPTNPLIDTIIPRSLYSSSGFSFGLDHQMAMKHGLLELIERHEFSNLLYRLDNDLPLAIKSISQQKNKIKNLENRFGGKVNIFNIAAEFSIPTILCVFYPEESNLRFPLVQVSSKTSFSEEDACEGALNELIQIIGL